MNKSVALLAGFLAWAGVAALSVLVVEMWQDENQILVFLPILAAVVIAWAIGEYVTERVFDEGREG